MRLSRHPIAFGLERPDGWIRVLRNGRSCSSRRSKQTSHIFSEDFALVKETAVQGRHATLAVEKALP